MSATKQVGLGKRNIRDILGRKNTGEMNNLVNLSLD